MKDFLRPTKLKVILAFLFPFYLGIVARVADPTTLALQNHLKVSWAPFVVLIFGGLALWATADQFFAPLQNVSPGQTVGYVFLEIILPLIINYLIVCAIIYFVQRLGVTVRPSRSANPPTQAQ